MDAKRRAPFLNRVYMTSHGVPVVNDTI